MAIELVSISKQADDRYSVTIRDTVADRTYSCNYNPATGKENLKKNLEALIADEKTLDSAEADIELDIKATVESIDPAAIGEK